MVEVLALDVVFTRKIKDQLLLQVIKVKLGHKVLSGFDINSKKKRIPY